MYNADSLEKLSELSGQPLALEKEDESLKSENLGLRVGDTKHTKMRFQLSEDNEELSRGFVFTRRDWSNLTEWLEHHDLVCKSGCGESKYTYTIVKVNGGTYGRVECDCGKEFVFSNPMWQNL